MWLHWIDYKMVGKGFCSRANSHPADSRKRVTLVKLVTPPPPIKSVDFKISSSWEIMLCHEVLKSHLAFWLPYLWVLNLKSDFFMFFFCVNCPWFLILTFFLHVFLFLETAGKWITLIKEILNSCPLKDIQSSFFCTICFTVGHSKSISNFDILKHNCMWCFSVYKTFLLNVICDENIRT